METARHPSLGIVARSAGLSALAGIAIVFLTTISRRAFWGGRLLLYGALIGFLVYAFCYALDNSVGDRVRGRGLLPDKWVGVPIYFVGGSLGLLAATLVLRAAGLMPFRMDAGDVRMSILISGAVAIVGGLLFYSFGVMRYRLQESIVRIKEQEFAEKELAVAREIQSRLLPPEEISGEGYRISARNVAARFVAGDFYDVFRLADGAVGIVVADVSGKGMGASLIMASVKAVLPLVAEGCGTGETLTRLNRKLHAELGAREFVALAYARYDPAARTVELSNAGLPDPYRVGGGRGAEPLPVSGPRFPLGARREVAYESASFAIGAGERLLLLTDGLPEAPAPDGDPLGYERLESLIPRAAATTGAMLDALFSAVRSATAPELADDWTALVFEPGDGAPR